MTVSPTTYLNSETVSRLVAAGRLTRFWGYVDHQSKDDE